MFFASINEKLIFYSIPVILFSLIPFFLITGPFLSDLSISLIALLFLYYCFKHKNFSYFNNKYFYFFLFFWIYLIFNSLFNNFNLQSFKISFFYFRYGVFVVAVIALLNTDDKFKNYFFYCLFVSFFILILDGYYEYFVGHNMLGNKFYQTRLSSFFGDKLILGSYLTRLWPIFFGLSLIFFKKKNKFYYILLIFFILSEILIFLSGERVAFFYINLSAFFVILFSNKLSKLRLLVLLSSFFLIITISLINPIAKERIFDLTLRQMNIFSQNEKKYIFSKQHNEMYITAYKMFQDNKIFGVGVKNFRNFCNDKKYYTNANSCSTHPHNTYLQILAELGIVGFIFLITVLFYFCKYVYKHLMLKIKGKYYFTDFEICILSGIAIYLWPIVPTGNVFNNWLTIALLLNLPFLAYNRTSSRI